MTEIKITDIKVVINRLLDHITETEGIETVEIKTPFYQAIPEIQVYDVLTDVTELDVGNLDDDLDFVSILLDPTEMPVAYQLTEAAPLLRYIGESFGIAPAKDGG